jgi:hypothetical protein
MSADNWTVCPRCRRKPEVAFGGADTSFREDWEIGVCKNRDESIPDTFEVHYRGGCRDCGLVVKFDHEMDVEVQP